MGACFTGARQRDPRAEPKREDDRDRRSSAAGEGRGAPGLGGADDVGGGVVRRPGPPPRRPATGANTLRCQVAMLIHVDGSFLRQQGEGRRTTSRWVGVASTGPAVVAAVHKMRASRKKCGIARLPPAMTVGKCHSTSHKVCAARRSSRSRVLSGLSAVARRWSKVSRYSFRSMSRWRNSAPARPST
jgi:hypothetical protein